MTVVMMTNCRLPRIYSPKCWVSKGRPFPMLSGSWNKPAGSNAAEGKSQYLIARASRMHLVNVINWFGRASHFTFRKHTPKAGVLLGNVHYRQGVLGGAKSEISSDLTVFSRVLLRRAFRRGLEPNRWKR